MRIVILLLLTCLSARSALFFNGTTANTKRPSNASDVAPFAPTISITISFWLKRTSTNYAGLMGHNLHDQGGGYANHTLSINNTATNSLEFGYQKSADASSHVFSSKPNAIPATNVWTHVAFTYTYATAGSATWYIDGVAQTGSSWTTGTGGGAPQTAVASDDYIGKDNYGNFFMGEIADVALYYNQALNSRQVGLLASKVKLIPLQVGSRTVVDGFSGVANTVVYYPHDQGPSFTTATAITNSCLDFGPYTFNYVGVAQTKATPLASPQWRAEQVSSYPPNE